MGEPKEQETELSHQASGPSLPPSNVRAGKRLAGSLKEEVHIFLKTSDVNCELSVTLYSRFQSLVPTSFASSVGSHSELASLVLSVVSAISKATNSHRNLGLPRERGTATLVCFLGVTCSSCLGMGRLETRHPPAPGLCVVDSAATRLPLLL